MGPLMPELMLKLPGFERTVYEVIGIPRPSTLTRATFLHHLA
jgi:hypothetical protein